MSLLKQAIVDAANLKEAALKNAEQLILEKYSNEIKTAVDTLLEQEEEGGLDLGADAGAETPAEEPTEPTELSKKKMLFHLLIWKGNKLFLKMEKWILLRMKEKQLISTSAQKN